MAPEDMVTDQYDYDSDSDLEDGDELDGEGDAVASTEGTDELAQDLMYAFHTCILVTVTNLSMSATCKARARIVSCGQEEPYFSARQPTERELTRFCIASTATSNTEQVVGVRALCILRHDRLREAEVDVQRRERGSRQIYGEDVLSEIDVPFRRTG